MNRIIDSINGNVQAQGIRVKLPAWMVLGSDEWNVTPDQIKAYAYQAALASGWTKNALIDIICETYTFIDRHSAKFTIDLLEDLVREYPLEVIENKKDKPKITLTDGRAIKEL